MCSDSVLDIQDDQGRFSCRAWIMQILILHLICLFFLQLRKIVPFFFFKDYQPRRGNFTKFMQRRYQNKGGKLSEQGMIKRRIISLSFQQISASSTSTGHYCLRQTVNAVEDLDSRLQRIKQEAAVIEQHNSNLENQIENNSDKETCKTAKDSEVCDVCLKYQTPVGHLLKL